MKTGIIGASGYTGQELVSLLIRHPEINLETVTSRINSGKVLSAIIPKLGKCGHALSFSNPTIEELAISDTELFFLALPHGTACEYAVPLVEAGKKVIDLSADYRLNDSATYKEYYGQEHPSPEWLSRAQYGLPELHDLSWSISPLIASPGCYPTSIIVPLAPLLSDALIETNDIVVNSISGISGAGKSASERLLFCERNESSGVYGLPKHRHLSEIEEQLSQAVGESLVLSFHPHLAPMNRGICSTISVRVKGKFNPNLIEDCWNDSYGQRPFVQILKGGELPETAKITGTNRIDLAVQADPRTNRYIISSAEDNLLKGAGGQAVQSMNLCNGYEEGCGLL